MGNPSSYHMLDSPLDPVVDFEKLVEEQISTDMPGNDNDRNSDPNTITDDAESVHESEREEGTTSMIKKCSRETIDQREEGIHPIILCFLDHSSSRLTVPSDGEDDEALPKLHEFNTQELGQMVFDMQLGQAKYEKKMMAHKHDQEDIARQQTIVNRNINDSLNNLAASLRLRTAPQPVTEGIAPATRGWTLPPSITTKLVNFNPDSHPKLTSGAPCFSGENVEDNTASKTWDSFLLVVKKRFDPDLYKDYIGRLATLWKSSTVEAYRTEFESASLFIAGLKPSLKQELLTRRPATLQDAFALAQQLSVCQAAATQPYNPKSSWPNRGNRLSQPAEPIAKRDSQPEQRQSREGQPPGDYPVFYALMGVDDDDDNEE
ncbi:hypothetical protein SASPL_137642 [Salvia splendens]|uniref:Retrotransposon gag domain-containing protein n=1 Tax=Salvia splendens TaxID=180675 RepID=A0A8X8ZE87_SALSN|nr:hypothetical protein SASPL_137642 [Salvia splendens]